MNFLKKIKKALYDYLDPYGYPSLNLYKRVKSHQFSSRNLSFFEEILDKLRRTFWTKIAKKHPGFACCYKKIYKESENINIKKIQKNGFVEIKDFLVEEDFLYIKNEVQEKINSVHNSKYFEFKKTNKGDFDLSKYSQELINKQIITTTKFFFGKELKPRIFLNYIYSENGENDFCPNSNWHADRFIPCINGLYFPLGCDWLPFERLVMSPYIKNDKELTYRQNHYPILEDKNLKKYTSLCPPNTLIIGFHHIFHRRSVLNSPGARATIFLEWYRQFNRIELIKSSFKENLFMKS